MLRIELIGIGWHLCQRPEGLDKPTHFLYFDTAWHIILTSELEFSYRIAKISKTLMDSL
jgi:hypothetical protein